ncbi:hypothetical protein NEOLEDRAFT_1181484 [Neolentinus lepideus HHB14362 ss-1]|uniref:protein-tyrosine-phosphatase n=1 Tax=Neolentinus lepideus HHB14362 ss-1 TaxID=1314782 RepID=A0A165PXX6_9AGAM|nr:hypothetical protein NEOLEDRAFT_1181484 [Neolentinus lepideus HHB14362 ss-1]
MQSSIDASRPRCATLPYAPRKRGPPAALRIHAPSYNNEVTLLNGDTPSVLSATSDSSDSFPFPQNNNDNKPRSLRNMKRLSLTIPSAESSTASLALSPGESKNGPMSAHPDSTSAGVRRRRPSVVSLPATSTAALFRKEEDGEGSPSAPYADGPIEILPRIWLGSEDNARDWKCLIERGIRSILNVAKEISSPFDTAIVQPRYPFNSSPDLNQPSKSSNSTYYPPHIPSGRPGMHYLRLAWSHGQSDLVHSGFPEAMDFVDQALERGDGVLIHCQCGVSRSATLVIALVMRAAASGSPSVSEEIRELKGMQGAYSYVKSKSRWVGPNMSLIYQLLDYERTLKGGSSSPASSERSSSAAEEEEEWGRRRQMLDDAPSDREDDREITEVMQEARALDKAMEDRMVARKASSSSMNSMSSRGMGPAWRSKYGSRKRTGSVASNQTGGSILSEDLVEEDEEQELLGVGGGFDTQSQRTRSSWCSEPSEEERGQEENPELVSFSHPFTPATARASTSRFLPPPPSAPTTKSTFTLPPVPRTAFKSSFDLPSVPPPASSSKSSFDLPSSSTFQSKFKMKRRPPPLGFLPPVPSSPEAMTQASSSVPARTRKDRHRPTTPPLHLRNSHNSLDSVFQPFPTPSQTLFVFPPSPTLTTRTPSTMTLTSNLSSAFPFPSVSTPRVSTVRRHGKTKSFIGLAIPPTPTTASSRVDARGWVGISKN